MTTLDTHDGIGLIDVVDLLTPEEIVETRELLIKREPMLKRNIVPKLITTWIFTR